MCVDSKNRPLSHDTMLRGRRAENPPFLNLNSLLKAPLFPNI